MIDIERLKEIDTAFQEVLALAEPKRARRLAQLRRSQPDIANEITRLLQNQQDANVYLERVRQQALDAIPTVAGPEWSESGMSDSPKPLAVAKTEKGDPNRGRIIGAYRLLTPLGHGGMGSVYLAERADGAFEKQVAIKIIRRALPNPSDEQRFRRECRLHAGLEHPHIARLMDSGVDHDGTSYLVMELVQGVPIDRYCRDKELSLRERLILFDQVLEAVQHAHRNLILHRDIKPSNVLVNDKGQVKLLDFGIAKFIQDEGPTDTRTGMQLFSPGYASPEQLLGCELTTASDVYGLGILLYELLADRRPFPDPPMGLPPLVGHRFAEKPSQIATDSATGPGSKRFRLQLRGDLDCLVLKALHPEVTRRYPTVDALKDEVTRVLEGRPIAARGDSWTYTAGKFARRHWLGLSASAAALVMVFSFIVVSMVQSRKIRAERDRYQQVTDQLTKLVHSADPDRGGSDVRFADVLQTFSDELSTEPDSEIKAKILAITGESYENLGLYPEAQQQLAQALEIQQRILGPNHRDTLFSQQVLAIIELRVGQVKGAEARARDLLQRRESVDGTRHHDTLMAKQLLAVLIGEQGRYEEARAMLVPVVADMRHEFGDTDEGFLGALENLARYENKTNHKELGLAHLREALRLKIAALGPEHPNTLSASVNLGAELMNRGQFEEAESLLGDTLSNHRSIYGHQHPKTLAAEQNVARLYYEMDRIDAALALIEPCVTSKREVLGRTNPATLASQILYANILRHAGQLEAALELARETEKLQIEVVGPNHPYTLQAMDQVASFLLDSGHTREARVQIEKALALKNRLYGIADTRVLTTLGSLATVMQAEGFAEQSLAIKEDILDRLMCDSESDLSGILVAMNNLAMGFKHQHLYRRSEEVLRDCLQRYRLEAGPTHFYTICTEINLVDVLRLNGKLEEAESLGRQAMHHADTLFPPGHPRTALALNYLAMVWLEQGQKEDAHHALSAALDGLESPDHPFATRIKVNLERLQTQPKIALN